MSQIRKRSLQAASWVYVGFLVGALNTYFFTHADWFSTEQYGLSRSLLDIGLLVSGFATFGVTSYLFKFFPYYKDNVKPAGNDMLAIALIVAGFGFVICCATAYAIEPLIQRKLIGNSPLLVEYFFYSLPLGGFMLLFNVLEAYSYGFDKGVLTSLLREFIARLFTLIIIILKIFGLIDFHQFMMLFTLQFAIAVIIILIILKKDGQLWLTLKVSRVTIKFRKKIISIMLLTFFVVVVGVLRQGIDSLVLASKLSLQSVGIFGFCAYLVSVLQAPFRSILAVTIPILSRSWKNKDLKEIRRIYQRSSINLLSFSLFVFGLILINFDGAISLFQINPEYLNGKWIFFTLGIVAIIEMGTGVNGQIIGTSTYWRFELWTSVLLTVIIIPLSIYFTVKFGLIGPALANLVSFIIYNLIRLQFLWKKFRMQPFNKKSLEILLVSCVLIITAYLIQMQANGIGIMLISSVMYTACFAGFMYFRNISPDVKPIINSLKNRFLKS